MEIWSCGKRGRCWLGILEMDGYDLRVGCGGGVGVGLVGGWVRERGWFGLILVMSEWRR